MSTLWIPYVRLLIICTLATESEGARRVAHEALPGVYRHREVTAVD